MINSQENPLFIPGLKLSKGFFIEEVEPVITSNFPGLAYSVTLIGSGSKIHNNLKITEPLSSGTYQFFSRPFYIIGGERFTKAIAGHISDPETARLAQQRPVGSIVIYSDNTDLLEDTSVRLVIK